jgi:hypothetical protein
MAVCEAPACESPVHAQGLCQKHYMRLRRTGSPEDTRGPTWRAKSKHPLWEAYKSMLRLARVRSGYDPRWKDFWAFVEDVGEGPSGWRLYRISTEAPYQKGNMEWRAPILAGERKADHAAYQRAYRMKRPAQNRDRYLRSRYGISSTEFEELLRSQGGGCALCGADDSHPHPHPLTGEKVSLAVDHDHETGLVRGILCHIHNRGIGLFSDDPDMLRRAAAYLEHHAAKT